MKVIKVGVAGFKKCIKHLCCPHVDIDVIIGGEEGNNLKAGHNEIRCIKCGAQVLANCDDRKLISHLKIIFCILIFAAAWQIVSWTLAG